MKAISTEKATLISTTSGMPFAPVAANEPVLERHEADHLAHGIAPGHHHQKTKQHDESAKARSSRARGSAAAVTRSMTTIERATSAMPASMVKAGADDGFDLRWMSSRSTIRLSAAGMMVALKTSAINAGDVEVRRVLHERLPRHRHREQHPHAAQHH